MGWIRSILGRPSLWVAVVTFASYWDSQALHGTFVYDDLGSVHKNAVVNGGMPWTEAFSRDFWSTPLAWPSSHKSFRPLTTLSFRVNWWASTLDDWHDYFGDADKQDTFGFRVVNVLLHTWVSLLVTEAAGFIFLQDSPGDTVAQLLTGLLFGLHPVHVEAVSNITSRGELLMSLFSLLSFLSFARCIHSSSNVSKVGYVWGVYIAPWLFMTASMFSKEQGATTLVSLACYDWIIHIGSVQDFLEMVGVFRASKQDVTEVDQQKQRAVVVNVWKRTLILASETVYICAFRYWLNGESPPSFIYDQNPAAFSKDAWTRIFSVNWVYCLYIYDTVFPKYLCCDWSGESIPLITTDTDWRIFPVLTLWIAFGYCCRQLLLRPAAAILNNDFWLHSRRVMLIGVFSFLFIPFLLSSNLIVPIGLMKGDRVIYLPLLGFCILEALAFKCLFCAPPKEDAKKERMPFGHLLGIHWRGHFGLMVQLSLFVMKTRERNLAWSTSFRLWKSAFEVNPVSRHTRYNYGYELALQGDFEASEQVMRSIGNPHDDSPASTFLYGLVLQNLGRCVQAQPLIEEALGMVVEGYAPDDTFNKEDDDVDGAATATAPKRHRGESSSRIASNLLVVKALCEPDIGLKGKIMFEAVQTDPQNDYAVSQANALVKQMERAQQFSNTKR